MHDPRVLVRCQGGARGVGIILVSAVEEVDSPERPFKERCRPQRPEDLRLGRTEERERVTLGGRGQSQSSAVMFLKCTLRGTLCLTYDTQRFRSSSVCVG